MCNGFRMGDTLELRFKTCAMGNSIRFARHGNLLPSVCQAPAQISASAFGEALEATKAHGRWIWKIPVSNKLEQTHNPHRVLQVERRLSKRTTGFPELPPAKRGLKEKHRISSRFFSNKLSVRDGGLN